LITLPVGVKLICKKLKINSIEDEYSSILRPSKEDTTSFINKAKVVLEKTSENHPLKDLILNAGFKAFSREQALAEMEKRIAREAAAQAERSFQAHFNNYAILVSFGIPTHCILFVEHHFNPFLSQQYRRRSHKRRIKKMMLKQEEAMRLLGRVLVPLESFCDWLRI